MKTPIAAVVALAVWALAGVATTSAQQPERNAGRPDLSGYWGPGRAAPPDAARVTQLPPNTVVLGDAGATEFPLGEYGGLKVKPAALAAARTWKPQDEMTVSRACLPPSIVYTMQGPFPMEIYQASELIVLKLEYFDLVRIVFMDGRGHPRDVPHSKVGHSIGRWEGSTLVVDTTHISESTITNNGLNHSEQVHVVERFWLSQDGKMLFGLQEFEDPAVLDNRGARFMQWSRSPGEYVFPYECDPSYGANYQK
jgi:hypothetical protein